MERAALRIERREGLPPGGFAPAGGGRPVLFRRQPRRVAAKPPPDRPLPGHEVEHDLPDAVRPRHRVRRRLPAMTPASTSPSDGPCHASPAQARSNWSAIRSTSVINPPHDIPL